MEVSAISRFVRVSPRKMQILVKGIKLLEPQNAVVNLTYINKSGAMPLKKLILSAMANAKNKGITDTSALKFKQIEVLPGSAMKRFRPVSRGMAHQYKKRMSHVRVVLTEDKSVLKKSAKSSSELQIDKLKSKQQNPKS